MTQVGEKEDKLSKGVGFATLKPTFPDASAQLVELMRATLKHAQEITAAVGEAEGAAERAQCKVKNVDALTTAAESRRAESEIERLTAWLNRPPPPPESSWIDKYRNKADTSAPSQLTISPATSLTAPLNVSPEKEKAPASSPPPVPPSSGSTLAPTVNTEEVTGTGGSGDNPGLIASNAMSSGSVVKTTASGHPLAVHSAATTGKTLTSEMAEEIETTVMWVQQLLESVHFVESDEVMEPGSSLLSAVQPGRRHQKELALTTSVNLFHEKKEEEEDAEDETAVFRSLALQTVALQRSNLPSRE